MSRRPVFLERRGYRRRRMMDGARMLPVLGAFLWLMPLVWALAPERVIGTAGGGIYVFAVWAALIGGAWAFSRALVRPDAPAVPETGAGPDRTDGSGGPDGSGG
ncbi:hypothetical protein P1J78_02470 [Psychromarinibacter sp. C21-152]|uniref:Uncharacterized protein n=1 Tax=Psychromarinibacter sediminicola TaxID=3033385 RepID=A0AAE3NNM3_9RHOB|nr:hypothetical protein [Psychromarinibacter sediminicola]MDF0599586.1 hypothetical protein [Psychromarinibacter sediminicola]